MGRGAGQQINDGQGATSRSERAEQCTLHGPSAHDGGYEPLDFDGEWLMAGGCAHLAVAMKQMHPHLKIAAAYYDDHGRRALAHAWAYDPQANLAYDGVGMHDDCDAPGLGHQTTDVIMDEDSAKLAKQMGFAWSADEPWLSDSVFDAAEFAQRYFTANRD
jgi:hypothetical protein